MNTKTLLACTAVVIAFALIVAPLAVGDDAFAKKSKKSNKASQSISQSSSSSQSSQSSGFANILSGNNVNVNVQGNTGSNNLVQNND
ncbi:MAG TPA: hypothetical protein VJR94_12915 [Candidatus Nitrosocosmicus sp.]|jgi:hypothetical protein|nr:hypothetical protein [Candidatus Nitrosocosmicus sp.]